MLAVSMAKCVVSCCPHVQDQDERRFFRLPQDPARIKVWLAALREPHTQQWTEEHVICEEHFLPEDLSPSGVSPDAIPIMPPCLEEELGMGEWAEEEQEEDWGTGEAEEQLEEDWGTGQAEEQEEDWGTGDVEGEQGWAAGEAEEEVMEVMEEIEDEAAHEEIQEEVTMTEDAHTSQETAPPGDPPSERDPDESTERDPDESTERDPEESTERDPNESTERDPEESTGRDPNESTERTSEEASGAAADPQSSPLPQRLLAPSWEQNKDTELELDLLTPQFLELLLNSDGCVDLLRASSILRTQSRRLYDITAVLRSLQLVQREATRVRWTGSCPISSFLWSRHTLQRESEKLKLVEETLDGLIKTCAQQLFTMTDDTSNAHSAYVTLADVQQLPVFQNQTVIVVRAPEETKLEVPSPTKDQIQVQLKSGTGPISVLMCDVWPQEATSSKFELIQKSRIRTSQLV